MKDTAPLLVAMRVCAASVVCAGISAQSVADISANIEKISN